MAAFGEAAVPAKKGHTAVTQQLALTQRHRQDRKRDHGQEGNHQRQFHEQGHLLGSTVLTLQSIVEEEASGGWSVGGATRISVRSPTRLIAAAIPRSSRRLRPAVASVRVAQIATTTGRSATQTYLDVLAEEDLRYRTVDEDSL